MPFATSEGGVRIHYELEGQGPPLVLMHGTGGSLELWRRLGYVAALRDRFQLLLVDSRGHGESDRPTTEGAYELRNRVLDLVAVQNDAGVQRSHFLGYSMGGWVGWGCLIYAPQRFPALAIGGFGPVADPYFGKTVEEFFGSSRWASFDAERQRVLRTVFGETSRFGGAKQALRTSKAPLFLFCGDQDPRFASMRDAAPLGRNASFLALPGKNHGTAMTDPDALPTVAPKLIEFFEAHPIS